MVKDTSKVDFLDTQTHVAVLDASHFFKCLPLLWCAAGGLRKSARDAAREPRQKGSHAKQCSMIELLQV